MKDIMKEKIFTCMEGDAPNEVIINADARFNNSEKRVKEDEDYRSFLRLADYVKDKDVVISGRMPQEGYAALGFYLVRFDAKSIVYNNEPLKIRNLLLYSRGNNIKEPKQWFEFTVDEKSDMAKIIRAPSDDGKWGDDVMAGLKVIAEINGKQSNVLTITGNGPQQMYAALGIAAAIYGYKEIRIEKMPVYPAIAFNNEQAGRFESPRCLVDNGIILGVLGDPHSGKSVFSINLSNCFRKYCPVGYGTWLYDCDMASPTPDWYYSVMSSGDEADRRRVTEMRDKNKEEWDKEKEDEVAQILKLNRKKTNLLIADMPGGKFSKGEESFTPDRIPNNTYKMMEQCDYFVILCRKDKPNVFDDWKEALRKYNLDKRVIARFITDSPESEVRISALSKDEHGIFTCEIQGLDRIKKENQIIPAMKESLGELIEFLINTNHRD